jgi:hypothetical protein
MHTHLESNGFSPPAGRRLGKERRTAMLAELVATFALALATLVVATVVSVGIAHAAVVEGMAGNEGNLFAVAMLLGVVFIAICRMLPNGESEKR